MSRVTGTTYQAIVGSLIVEHRRLAGLSQGELADRLGVSQSAWSRVEKGETGLSLEQLAKVANAIGIWPHELIEEADRAKRDFEQSNVKVANSKSEASGWLLLGAAALGVVILANMNKKK